MKLLDSDETILIAVGEDPLSLGRDRELARRLKAEIDARGAGFPYRHAVVVGDEDYFAHEALEGHPVIAIGGPGVNAVSRDFSATLETVYAREDRLFVQLDLDRPSRASCWGVDSVSTGEALEAFVGEGYLDEFLERVWQWRSEAVN